MVAAPQRRGVTLIEVLMAIFVMGVGLLGVLTLFPLGALSMSEAVKHDRTGTLGRAAHRELLIRDYLNPRWWRDPPGNTVVVPNPPFAPIIRPLPNWLPPFAIDPLVVSYPAPVTPGDFPVNALAAAAPGTQPPFIKRFTLGLGAAPVIATVLPTMPYPLAERIFFSRDDLAMHFPTNPERLPAQIYSRDAGGVAQSRQFTGDYSWMFTVSPTLGEVYGAAAAPNSPPTAGTVGNAATARMFSVATVVFYKRELDLLSAPPNGTDPPQERMVLCDFLGGGFGGGDVLLRLGGAGTANWLDVKPSHWIMLVGETVDGLRFVQWYRVAGVDDGTNPAGRLVALAGPDWPTTGIAVDEDNNGPFPAATTAYAVLFNGCVGVFEKSIQNDGTSFWSQ